MQLNNSLLKNGGKTVFPKTKPDHVFGQRWIPSKLFHAGLYARVSTNDQRRLSMQSRAMRRYFTMCGWLTAVQIERDLPSAAQRELRERKLGPGCGAFPLLRKHRRVERCLS
jgi:hypothetical protein